MTKQQQQQKEDFMDFWTTNLFFITI